MPAHEHLAAPASQRLDRSSQPIPILHRRSRERRPMWSRLPERQIAAQHRETGCGESISYRHQQWRPSIRSRTMRQDQSRPARRIRFVQKSAHRRSPGRILERRNGRHECTLSVVTRRQLIQLPAFAALARGAALSQSGFPGVAYRDYPRCLPDFLRDLAARAYQARNREIAKLDSAETIRRRQQWVRETFWKLAGGMPERTPLNTRTVGSFERQGYRVEKLVYESVPRFYIPADLYIPSNVQPPFPGVLFQMGHTPNGKAGDTYQRCCQGLAKLGYLVLAFDPMGQGERIYYPNSSGIKSRLSSADSEHTAPGKQMLLTGDTATRMQVWDAVRSLDVLAAHPLVDPHRLASTGQSGGGTITMLLLAVDDRLAAAVVASGNTENLACADFNPPGSTDDAEQNLIGAGPVGFDRWDLLYPFAPKPLLITVSDMDFYHTYSPQYIRNGWEEFQKLRAVYERLDAADRLAWGDTPFPHSLAYDSRLQVYSWFARWLKHEAAPVTEEPPVEPEPDRTLWVSESGNMLRSFHSETPFTLNRARLHDPSPAPLAQLIGADLPPAGLEATVLRRVPYPGIIIESLEVASAPHVWLPAWLYLPAQRQAGKPLLLVLEPIGRDARAGEGGLYQTLAHHGYPVCAADLRGIGDLAPEVGRGAPAYARPHSDEENYAWASLMLGQPLIGQRVTDILALSAALRAHPELKGLSLRIVAAGRLAPPALIAAALDDSVADLYLSGSLVSYRSIVETEQYAAPFANFVPGILLHTDLPRIAQSLSPRRITLAATVNAAGDPLDVAAVRAVYAGNHITVRPEANWGMEALAG
jgi:dienelactone hydrolase